MGVEPDGGVPQGWTLPDEGNVEMVTSAISSGVNTSCKPMVASTTDIEEARRELSPAILFVDIPFDRPKLNFGNFAILRVRVSPGLS